MTTPNDKADLREQVRQLIIDPSRLEFGETKVNLRVGGTVDRIMNLVRAHDQNLKAAVLGALPEKCTNTGADGYPSVLSAEFQKMYDKAYNQALAEVTQAINKVFEEGV